MSSPPRLPLAILPTPLVPARQLSLRLGADVWVKRDDLTGFAFGGTKARVVEVLLADALARGHDEIIGCGGSASNLCQALAAAAARGGLRCTLVLYGREAKPTHPNLAAMQRWGAEVVFTGDDDRTTTGAARGMPGHRANPAGRTALRRPRGGATPLGTLAYAAAADELDRQLTERGLDPERIVLPVGSGGTIAGLVVGVSSWSRPTLLTGAVVSRPQPETAAAVNALATAAAQLDDRPPPDPIRLDLVDAIGPGFGRPTPELVAASRLVLDTEGLVVDITYGARAVSVLTSVARDATGPIVLWHTGGWLDAVADLLNREPIADERAARDPDA